MLGNAKSGWARIGEGFDVFGGAVCEKKAGQFHQQRRFIVAASAEIGIHGVLPL